MTKEEFQKLTQNVVLLDGATGSNLMASGMPRGICTEAWIMEHKEILQNLQKAYAEAGSQIVYAPTFGGNRYSLGLHGLQDKLVEMNHALVNISREAVGHKVYVAGDITTTGKMMEPAGDLTYEMAYETYCEQIKAVSYTHLTGEAICHLSKVVCTEAEEVCFFSDLIKIGRASCRERV